MDENKIVTIEESGYKKIARECRSIDVSSNENDMRNVLQVILMIAEEEIKKELNTSADNENV